MKGKTPSFRTKLWLYFALFAAVILSLLWILQTVFLQRLYNSMMIRNIHSAAEQIEANSREEGLDDLIDRLSVENSLLIYLTDEDGNVRFNSDSYKPYFRQGPHTPQGPGKNDQFRQAPDPEPQRRPYRDLPDDYEDFLVKMKESPDHKVSYTQGDHFIYGSVLNTAEAEDVILFVSGTLEPVGGAVSIIRILLLIVTILSLVLAFFIAWFIARRFSGPIDQLSAQAQLLGSDRYEDHFQKGFCRELDDLDEAMNKSAEKLSEAQNYQKELLANVSHDLRTPLTMIRGYAEMLRDFSWEDESQRNADTGVIIREADRLTALVNEILEYSRLQDKNRSPEFTDVDFSALTERVLDRFEPLFRHDGGTIERSITPGCTVRGNEELLERAVFNLIDNAVRHCSETDKRITVTVSRTDRVQLKVQDYGEGIDPEELPHIWEKYYTSRQRGGRSVSGLGLAIVKQTALIHNAEVSAESQPGKGSTFCFTI